MTGTRTLLLVSTAWLRRINDRVLTKGSGGSGVITESVLIMCDVPLQGRPRGMQWMINVDVGSIGLDDGPVPV